MKETIDWVVQGSRAPLSIVIIGLGNDAFKNMDILDADDEPLTDSHGRKMERDIVQFVPYRSIGNSLTQLARQVLDEVPREIVNFYTARRIWPNPPIQADPEAEAPMDSASGSVRASKKVPAGPEAEAALDSASGSV